MRGVLGPSGERIGRLGSEDADVDAVGPGREEADGRLSRDVLEGKGGLTAAM